MEFPKTPNAGSQHQNAQRKTRATFGSTIKQARIAAGLSMSQAAEEAGISKSLLRFWELDEVDSPDLGKLMRLAAALELDPIDLADLAGYDVRTTLPPMQPYLRSKYPELPASALAQITAITKKYGIDPTGRGPAPGEDET